MLWCFFVIYSNCPNVRLMISTVMHLFTDSMICHRKLPEMHLFPNYVLIPTLFYRPNTDFSFAIVTRRSVRK